MMSLLNFEQNIEYNKLKKELQERRIGEKKAKQAHPYTVLNVALLKIVLFSRF